MKYLLIVSTYLLSSFFTQAQPFTDSLDAFMKKKMQDLGIPGLQIAVVKNGKIIKSSNYGLANIQDSIPVKDNTIFTINSIAKAFIGVAIMQLVEDKKVDLDKPVSAYLDSLPVSWQPVTLKRLLTHTSGIPDMIVNGKMIKEGEEWDAWDGVQKLPMEYPTGERFSYNQTGYVLLGKVIKKVSGKDFTDFVQERQLNVVGMPSTIYGDALDIIPNSCREYTFIHNIDNSYTRSVAGNTVRGSLGNVYEEFPRYFRTASGINSTAIELAKWIIALQKGKLFKDPNSLTTLWKPGLLNNGSPAGFSRLLNGYALGFETSIRDEHPAVTAIGGGRAALFIYPNDDLSIIILTNLQASVPEDFIDEAAGYYIPDMKASNGFGLIPSIKLLRAELLKTGFTNSLDIVKKLKKKDQKFDLLENDLNQWGYNLISQGEPQNALEIFRLNIALYPASWNVYDSYGELLLQMNRKEEAIKMYKKSVELNPQSEGGKKILEQLLQK